MIVAIKKFIVSIIKKHPIGKKYLSIYMFGIHHLEKIGWLKSIEMALSVDRHGKPLPWYTYAAIYFIEKRVKSWMTVFEYGSGNSTLWWSAHVTSVISIEHDLSWFDNMKNGIPSNIEYRYCELIDGGRYCKVVSEYEKQFDIIVIDGRDRVNCAKNSLTALKENGVIIWDNSDRNEYLEGYQYLLEAGFKRLDFNGYGPVNVRDWCTSIFYRDHNCFGI